MGRGKFANQVLTFKGSADVKFGELVTNYDNQSLTVEIIETAPKRDFKGTYLSVEIEDNFGQKIYELGVEGTTNTLYHTVSMREGFVIQIYHTETPKRLYSQEAIVDITNNTNRWLVTRYGLKNMRLRNDPLYDYVTRLDEQAIILSGSDLQFIESEDIQQLLIAIISLPQPYRSLHLTKYISMFPKCIVQPIIGNKIESVMEGSIDLYLKQDFEDLIGTEVQLKLGEDLLEEVILYEHQTPLHFDGIGVGVYSVEFRGKSMKGYIVYPQYIEVNNYENSVIFDFEKINYSVLMDQTIEFYGLGDILIGALRVSFEEGSIIMSVMRSDAHNYYEKENYAFVQVTTKEGLHKYKKIIKGLNNAIVDDVIPLMVNDVIEVYHMEGFDRLQSKNVLIDKSDQSNSWLVTEYGLQNQKYNNDPLEELMNTTDLKAADIVSNPFKYGVPFYLSEEKKQLLGAIHTLPESQRQIYLNKYRRLFPKNRGTFTVSFTIDYPEELTGRKIGIRNKNFNQVQNVEREVITFNNLPYGYYAIRVPEQFV